MLSKRFADALIHSHQQGRHIARTMLGCALCAESVANLAANRADCGGIDPYGLGQFLVLPEGSGFGSWEPTVDCPCGGRLDDGLDHSYCAEVMAPQAPWTCAQLYEEGHRIGLAAGLPVSSHLDRDSSADQRAAFRRGMLAGEQERWTRKRAARSW